MIQAIGRTAFFAACLFLASCSSNIPDNHGMGNLPAPIQTSPCGASMLFDMMGEEGISSGYLEVYNDSSELCIIFKALPGMVVNGSSLQYFPESNAEIALAPLTPHNDGSWRVRVPLHSVPTCGRLKVSVKALRPGQSKDEELLPSGTRDLDEQKRIQFCKHSCGEMQDCFGKSITTQFRSYTDGQWFTEAQPANSYLKLHFEGIFPQGLEMGCETKRRIQTVPMLMSWLDGYNTAISKALAREVAALELNIRFDEADTSFAPSSSSFSRLVVASGNFGGWTTLGLLEEGQAVLGDCPSNYSVQQMTAVIREVNASLADPGKTTGFLICQ